MNLGNIITEMEAERAQLDIALQALRRLATVWRAA